jgi:hypothetical protein
MDYSNKTFNFNGILSGDGECFCWVVDKETFIEIIGEEPEVPWDSSRYCEGKYNIYPGDLFGVSENKEMNFSISIKKI